MSAVNAHNTLREGLPFRAPASALWAGYGTGAAIGVVIASLLEGDALHLIAGGVVGLIVAVLLHFAALLFWPIWGRLRLRRVYGTKVPIVADRTIREVMSSFVVICRQKSSFAPTLRPPASVQLRT